MSHNAGVAYAGARTPKSDNEVDETLCNFRRNHLPWEKIEAGVVTYVCDMRREDDIIVTTFQYMMSTELLQRPELKLESLVHLREFVCGGAYRRWQDMGYRMGVRLYDQSNQIVFAVWLTPADCLLPKPPVSP